MFAKFFQWLLAHFGIPLLRELGNNIILAVKKRMEIAREEKENKIKLEQETVKAEEYEKASTKDDAKRAFDSLP